MVTIGDVLAVIGIVTATILSVWALVMAVSTLFEARAARARARIEHSPGRVTLLGAVMALLLGIVAGALLNHPIPWLKLLGWVLYLLLLLIGAIGFSGLAGLLAQRLAHLEPALTPYAALSRATLFCVLAALVPILGWFVVGPLMAFASIGAGAYALVQRTPVAASAQPANNTAC
jgi:hypothetical protein